MVQQYGLAGLAVATVMAGVLLVLMGCLRLGGIIKFIPYPVVVGFTSGIALTIFSQQIKDLFGLQIADVPADFIQKWAVYAGHFSTLNPWALGVGVLSVALIALTPKVSKRVPGSLVAIVVMTVAVYFLREKLGIRGIETIGDRFSIDPSLPRLEAPAVTFATIQELLPTAFTIAMLGAIESLLSATVADGVTGDKHDSNTELIAQGVANMVTPFSEASPPREPSPAP